MLKYLLETLLYYQAESTVPPVAQSSHAVMSPQINRNSIPIKKESLKLRIRNSIIGKEQELEDVEKAVTFVAMSLYQYCLTKDPSHLNFSEDITCYYNEFKADISIECLKHYPLYEIDSHKEFLEIIVSEYLKTFEVSKDEAYAELLNRIQKYRLSPGDPTTLPKVAYLQQLIENNILNSKRLVQAFPSHIRRAYRQEQARLEGLINERGEIRYTNIIQDNNLLELKQKIEDCFFCEVSKILERTDTASNWAQRLYLSKTFIEMQAIAKEGVNNPTIEKAFPKLSEIALHISCHRSSNGVLRITGAIPLSKDKYINLFRQTIQERINNIENLPMRTVHDYYCRVAERFFWEALHDAIDLNQIKAIANRYSSLIDLKYFTLHELTKSIRHSNNMAELTAACDSEDNSPAIPYGHAN